MSVSPKPPLDYKTLWGHGQCLLCCLLSHPTYTALTMHLNQWLLDWMRVPPDNKVHDFFTVLSWARRRSHFPCLILFAPRAWESGFVFKIRWTSSSPLPLNEGSAEAKGSVLWNGYCNVARDCWATSHAFGFIIRGLYTGAGSLPVFFFFFLKQLKTESLDLFWGGKRTRDFVNSYEKSQIGPFWNLPTLTVSL